MKTSLPWLTLPCPPPSQAIKTLWILEIHLDKDEKNVENFKWTPDKLVGSETKNDLFLTFQIESLKDHKTIITTQGMRADSTKSKSHKTKPVLSHSHHLTALSDLADKRNILFSNTYCLQRLPRETCRGITASLWEGLSGRHAGLSLEWHLAYRTY